MRTPPRNICTFVRTPTPLPPPRKTPKSQCSCRSPAASSLAGAAVWASAEEPSRKKIEEQRANRSIPRSFMESSVPEELSVLRPVERFRSRCIPENSHICQADVGHQRYTFHETGPVLNCTPGRKWRALPGISWRTPTSAKQMWGTRPYSRLASNGKKLPHVSPKAGRDVGHPADPSLRSG